MVLILQYVFILHLYGIFSLITPVPFLELGNIFKIFTQTTFIWFYNNLYVLARKLCHINHI